MIKTRGLVEAVLHKDIAGLVLGYMMAEERDDWQKIAEAGEWETCAAFSADVNCCLSGACCGGHYLLAESMISRGAVRYNNALGAACRNAHYELINLIVSCGPNNWTYGLVGACLGGHADIADDMIRRGAHVCVVCSRPHCHSMEGLRSG